MKSFNTNSDQGANKEIEKAMEHNPSENYPHKSFRQKVYHKFSNMANKARDFAKRHFPVRIWAKGQEKHKGQRIK